MRRWGRVSGNGISGKVNYYFNAGRKGVGEGRQKRAAVEVTRTRGEEEADWQCSEDRDKHGALPRKTAGTGGHRWQLSITVTRLKGRHGEVSECLGPKLVNVFCKCHMVNIFSVRAIWFKWNYSALLS